MDVREQAQRNMEEGLKAAYELLEAGHGGEAVHTYMNMLGTIEVQEDPTYPWVNLKTEHQNLSQEELEEQIRQWVHTGSLTFDLLEDAHDIRIVERPGE